MKRLRIQFGLRAFLLAIAVVGLVLGWLGSVLKRAHEQRVIVGKIQAAGGQVVYDYQVTGNSIDYGRSPPGPKILRLAFGDDLFARVVTVSFLNPVVKASDLELLNRLPELKDVGIYGALSDRALSHISSIRKLRELVLSDTGVTADGLARLTAQSKSLQSLTLVGASITDGHLKNLHKLPSLIFLQVVRTSVTDQGMKYLGQIHQLRGLDLYTASRVGDQGIQQLRTLKNIEHLRIDTTKMTDKSLAALRDMTHLERLDVPGHRIGDAGVKFLTGLRMLHDLELSGTRVSDKGIAHLCSCSRLKSLRLGRTRITDAAIAHLDKFKELDTLEIGFTKVTTDGLHELPKRCRLTWLGMSLGNGITSDGVRSLQKAMPNCTIQLWKPDGTGMSLEEMDK